MKEFKARKLMFKAWNKEAKLLMRLNSIECRRGELIKKDHILLQYSGLLDMEGDEIYEMDILLQGSKKFLVLWDDGRNGWVYVSLPERQDPQPLTRESTESMKRLWSYFESEKQ